MIKQLQELHRSINSLWNEDAYDFVLTFVGKSTILRIVHRYENKTRPHPENKVFEGEISEDTFENVCSTIRERIISRAVSLAESHKSDYEAAKKRMDSIVEEVAVAGRRMDERLHILKELKESLKTE